MLASILRILVLISGLVLAALVGVVALLTKGRRRKLAVAGVAVALAVLSLAAFVWIPKPPSSYQLVRPAPVDNAVTLYYSDRALYALRVRDGTLRWQHPTPGPTYFAWSPPTLDNGVLYASSGSSQSESGGDVAAIRASDGTEIWHVQRPELGPLQVVGDSIVVVGYHQFDVLRLSDGAAVRTLPVPQWDGPPTLDGSAAYGCQGDGTLVALRLSDAQPLWRTSLGATPSNRSANASCSATLADGVVYAQTPVPNYGNPVVDSSIVAVRASDGQLLWRYHLGPSARFSASTGMIFTVVYGATSTDPDTAIALRSNDGSLLWQHPLGIVPLKLDAVTATAGALYVGLRGSLLALRPDDGVLLWLRKDTTERAFLPLAALNDVVFVQYDFVAPGPAYGNGFPQNYLLSLRPSDGALYWQTPAEVFGSPVVSAT
jgi:outer membrane protein assembly factor BamB